MAGALGGVAFGWLGGSIGRTKAMMWSVLAYSIFSGLCAFATAPWHIGAAANVGFLLIALISLGLDSILAPKASPFPSDGLIPPFSAIL